MADTAAMSFLLENFGQLALRHIQLLASSEDQVNKLIDELKYLTAILQDASIKKPEERAKIEVLRRIRNVVYDAEDVVDDFIALTEGGESKSTNCFLSCHDKTFKMDRIARNVEKVRNRIKSVYGENYKADQLASLGIGEPHKPEVRCAREDYVVGFEDETKAIIGYLKEETDRLDIISIVGLPGQGKTELARKIFGDSSTREEFPTRIWVYVSKFTPKDVLLSILRQITTITDDMRSMPEHELGAEVSKLLKDEKFLVVMDDVWSTKDLERIFIAFPRNNHISKILITTRFVDITVFANCKRQPKKLRDLTAEESWELLQYEVYRGPKCELELVECGIKIATECKGLPIAIVIIGGILKKIILTKDEREWHNAWKNVSETVHNHLDDDPNRTLEKLISLSYEDLPHYLRACYLYMGMFPQDMEIPTWKLFRMWIAEGFIQERNGCSLEETAENSLDELILRNLVKIDKRSTSGKVKTCRIHDLHGTFCKKEAGSERENFFLEITKPSGTDVKPSIIKEENHRRLCIHSNISEFLSSKPSGRHVRSFVCFSQEEVTLEANIDSAIPVGFKKLRVLDVKPIKFTKIPSNMYCLLHLRYIHLSFHSSILRPSFAKLWNLQTLIVDTTQNTLKIHANIWKMRHLRHLKTNKSSTLPEPSDDEACNLQTLGKISPEYCTDRILCKARNLKTVSVCGRLTVLLNGCSFKNMRNLTKLEKLKLQNDEQASDGVLPNLPPFADFPPNLRILTLSATVLEWSEMKVLASLDNLEVLKLKEKAFMGSNWEIVDAGFQRLKVLFIGRTNLEVWKLLAADCFPVLMHLELQDCEKLQEIPNEFADIPNFRVLILNNCPTAADSAKKIQEKKMTRPKEKGNKPSEFRLSICMSIKQ